MNLNQFFNILWSRRILAFSVVMVTVFTSLLVSLIMSKQYVAETSIIVAQHSVDPVTGQILQLQLPNYMATQLDMIASHNVGRKVVEKLKLVDHPQMQKEFPNAQKDFANAGNIGDINDWLADMLLKKLDISPSRESSVIRIKYTSTDPQFAALIANAFADAYILTDIELRAHTAKLSANWFDSQITTLRDQLEHAQSVLSSYQQQHGIISTDGQYDLESSRLTSLSRQLMENQSRTEALESRKLMLSNIVQKGGMPESLPEVLNNPLIQSLKLQLAGAEAKFADLSKRIDINNPKYKQASAELKNLQNKIHAEVKMVSGNITNEVASSKQRDNILTSTVNEQKTKVLNLKKQHDEIALLKREVESAQRSYDAAMQRGQQSRMESEMKQTNIAVSNPAFPPQKHAKPQVILNVISAFFLGGLLGIAAALMAESRDRKIRSEADIAKLMNVPVYALSLTPVVKLK